MTVLKLEGVCKKFGNHKVIENFSYSFEANKIYAIVGPSGSGKSTLLNIMGLLEKADCGTLSYFGEEIHSVNSHKTMMLLRNKIAYLFQNYALIDNETVEYNMKIAIAYQKGNNKEEQMKTALATVGLKGFEKKKVFTLSGGEQQRVALARVMVKPCDLVLADEPTGNLDEKNKEEVFSILRQMCDHQKTVIIVTHDHEIVKKCDEVIVLKKV